MQRPQRGFTLVEIAIVLVVIGLLLGGVLKGQELIASSRVRNLSDQQAGIQAAFYGFQDRYQAIPGDMDGTEAAEAMGETASGYPGGDANGQLGDATGNTTATGASSGMQEPNSLWIHLSDAGFIRGTYSAPSTLGSSSLTAENGPQNVFNGNLVMARHGDYDDSGAPPPRLLLHMGRRVPVDIAREFDVKLDDGQPQTGVVRSSPDGTAEPWQGASACTASGSDGEIWDIGSNSQDCNPVYLF